jgi:purine-binding chemotaxis protein CheW
VTADKKPRKTTKKASGSTSGSAAGSSSKSGARKTPAKKTAAKKATPKKTPAKKTAPKSPPETSKADEAVEAVEAPEETPVAETPTTPEEPMVGQATAETDTPGAAVESDADKVELVQAPEPDSAGSGETAAVTAMAGKIIAFHLGGQRYAVPIESVQEIQQIVAFSEIPAAGGAVIGMVNLRGSVIPAIDMRFLIGLAPEEYEIDTPMIICHAHGQLVALIVDQVEDVLTMPEGCLDPPPAMHNLSSKMIGVCRMGTDLVYLLEVESLIAPVELSRG